MKFFDMLRLAGVVGLVFAARPVMADDAPLPEGPPPRPPLPEIEALRLEPAELTLTGTLDSRGVLVSGRTPEGDWIDLTHLATLESDSELIEIDGEGYVHPLQQGQAEVTVWAAGLPATLGVKIVGAARPPIRFVRDVMPILSKVGCNAGTCHGAAAGRNGFKLSLRGYDPSTDYLALIDDLSGRRFNRAAPDQSLMLLKPTAEVPHEGGQVVVPGTRWHEIMRRWIAEGVAPEDAAEGRAVRLEVLPAHAEIALPGMTQRMLVVAHYADGRSRDVTREAIFTSNLEEVAKVGEGGEITAIRRGEAALLVRYENNYATVGVAVMGNREGFEWHAAPEANFIDRLVNAKLQSRKILASPRSSDTDFIRRVYLDLTGLPPRPAATRAFLADATPTAEKRERLIDELIGSKDYVEHWTNKWADLLQCNSKYLGEKGVFVFRDWIRASIDENVPYNEFVLSLLKAEGSTYKNPEANYYRALREPSKATEDVSQLFLGVRFTCAKCHDHPFEKWTQNQYYEFGAYFARVGLKRGQLPGEEIVYTKYNDEEFKHLKTGRDMAPSVPFGAAAVPGEGQNRRAAFAEWLVSEENPLFARAMSNRLWSYFFGRGIIEPVDDIRASNPASNPALLDALTETFIETGFDLRAMMRIICLSETYQRSIQSNRWNEDDTMNFSHAAARRLTAEQLVDAIAQATGSPTQFKGLPRGLRAAELPDGPVRDDTFLKLFGRPKRESVCECERTSNVSLSHALNLINGPTVGEALLNKDGRLAGLIDSEQNDEKVIEELFLAVLCRFPTPMELEAIDFDAAQSRLEGAQDLTWALLNSPAFVFNH